MSSYFETIEIVTQGSTTTLWLSRASRLNVLTRQMLDEITVACREIAQSDATGVVIGARGRLFSAGHDFSEMYQRSDREIRELFDACEEAMRAIREMPQPTVARVHALATGAGCQLVATTDLAVASDEATFATPGGKGGLFCTTPMVAVARLVGRRRAVEMAFSGDAISAVTAQEWGLVNRVVPEADLDQAVADLLWRVTRGSTIAKSIGKRALYRQLDLDLESAYEFASGVMSDAATHPDAQESFLAFMEKRAPRFSA